MKSQILLIAIIVLVSSCTPTPESISYGSDMCHFCKMTIVDQQHASELVTQKGKIFKFDAIECMINYQKEDQNSTYAFELVNVYESPKELIYVEKASFLISKSLPSPMGAYLTAFKSENVAKEFKSKKGGELYTWQTLKDHFNQKDLTGN